MQPSAQVLGSPNLHYYIHLREAVSSYLSPENVQAIDRAFVMADQAHSKQRRASGEPYIIHPIAVASIVAQMHLDAESVQAALLHDVVEDTELTDKDLQDNFGLAVKNLVEGVTKLDKLAFHNYREAQTENFRKMILAMTQDIRVILIKLADRTHNMRTLGALRPDKRKRIARETLDIFAPIANRLGISDIKSELEELGLAALYPQRYRVLKAAVSRASNNRREIISGILKQIRDRLTEVDIPARVLGREKHIYSIYRKMVRKELQFSEIMDVYAFRIILKDVDTCYRVLGQMHNLFKPRPGGFKDYIAIPKINGYQSLHTSLIGPHGVPVELQIRTEFMDQVAARGVAAHWAYKEKGSEPVSTTSQRNAQVWLKNINDLQKSSENSSEFINDVKTDLFSDAIYIFTPEGKIYDLPKGATPVDFAYAVHTDIGAHCIGAVVNHRSFPLSHKLQSGQTVEIITNPNARPNAIWLSSVVTSKARSKIRQYLKGLRAQECELIGRRLLLNALHGRHIEDIPKETVDKVLKQFNKPDLKSLFADVAMGNILTVSVAAMLAPDETEGGNLPVTGTGGVPYVFAQCCMPIPGDEIIAHVASGRGLVIHSKNCPNLRATEKDPSKLLKVGWDLAVASAQTFNTCIIVEHGRRQGIMTEILNAVDMASSSVQNISSEQKDDQTSLMKLIITVRDRLHLAGVMKRIKAVPGVVRIARRR
ncbi:MAG: bifunctional GTP diphosphokinase/guanosine-3',5'-bis pyrophosphate 3'-pyrophosphohydrolase [Succinivibrio sp.]|nr:bifunctional GTP diphosphokinase/guanosine-3',5'-bis pyrophosphate 3'-pyrophosphohydrolase [Succinivibrio sp.]